MAGYTGNFAGRDGLGVNSAAIREDSILNNCRLKAGRFACD